MWLVTASTRSWCSASIVSTVAPSASQNSTSAATLAGSAPSGGVTMHQRWWNSVAKPASGPLCSVPATGCAGITRAAGQRLGERLADALLGRADVADHGAGRERRRRSRARPRSIAPTGTHRITRSASATASAAVSQIVVGQPALARRGARTAGSAVVAGAWRRRAGARAPRARSSRRSARAR